jgi:hypothetical protein
VPKRFSAIALLAVLGLCPSTRGSAAQAQSDMLAALGASGPHAAVAASKAFDGVIGAWDFDCTIYPEDGGTYEFKGEWIFDWVLDGTAIQDVWMGYKDGRAPGVRHMGTSLRFFDRQLGEWRVLFIVPLGNKVIQLHGGESGGRIVLNGVDVDGSLLRWSFNDLRPESFVWRGEISHDGGKSWRVEQIMKLRRRQRVELRSSRRDCGCFDSGQGRRS